MDDNDAIRGQLDSIILRSLLDRDEYGLEIYNNIKLLDNVMGEVKQSTFYNALKRLENARLISSYEGDISKGAKRVYYSITPNGRRYLLDEYKRWDIDSTTEFNVFDSDEDDDDDNTVYKKRKRTRKTKSIESDNFQSNNSSINDFESKIIEKTNTNLVLGNSEEDSASLPHYTSTIEQQGNALSENNEKATISKHDLCDNTDATQPRYTSDIKLSTIIGGKYPPKSEPQPKIEEPDNRSAQEILYSNDEFNDNTTTSATRYTLLGGVDDSQTIEGKKARLNHILSMDFSPVEPKQTETNSLEPNTALAENNDKQSDSIQNDLNQYDSNDVTKSDFADYSDTIIVENNNISELQHSELMQKTQNITQIVQPAAVDTPPHNEILNKPYVETYVAPKEIITENVNYIDSLANIYKKGNEDEENIEVIRKNSSVEVTRINTLNFDDYDEEKFKETSLNKLKQRLTLENIKLKQYVKSNTTSFYIGKYYYNNQLMRDSSLITYILFLAMCISAHFIAAATNSANVALTVVFSVIGAIYPIYACAKWYVMPAKRKRLPLNLSMMFIASLLIYVLSIVIIVIVAFFCFNVNVAVPSSTVAPLILPLIICAIVPLGVLIYAVLFRTGRYNLK